jgi:hypothetical protein
MMNQMLLARRGMGYVGLWDNGGVEIGVDHLRRRSGELHGELTVSSSTSNVLGGRLHRAAFNISSTQGRERLARSLENRAKLDVPWGTFLEEFCAAVLEAERTGAPIIEVGSLADPRSDGYLIDPVLPAHQPSIIYAAGGTGKSYLAVLMAVSVAAGVPVLGWPVIAPGPVLYCDWETDQWEVNARVRRVAAGLGIAPPPGVLYRLSSGSMDDAAESLAAVVTERGIKLVVVDSVGMASGAVKEGPAEESAIRLFSSFRYLGCTVLAIDHVTGEDARSEKGIAKPYGSIYKVNLARSVWELRGALGEEGSDEGHLALIHRKVNGPDYVRFEREQITDDRLVRASFGNTERIVRALRGGPLTVAEVAEDTGIGEGSVRVALNRVRGGQVTKLDDGRWALLVKDEA